MVTFAQVCKAFENELGATMPFKYFDPLGMAKDGPGPALGSYWGAQNVCSLKFTSEAKLSMMETSSEAPIGSARSHFACC